MTKSLRFSPVLLFAALTLCGARASTTHALPPVPTSFSHLPAPADTFTFCVAGDNRSTGHGYPMPPSLEQICREIGWIQPAFTLWSGDAIEGYDDTPEEANGEYDVFLKSVELTRRPLFNAPGNHELGKDPKLVAIYEKRLGPLYGSFDYGTSHFIALNTDPILANGKIGEGELDDTQWAWLESDLKANASARNLFVFMHHYVFGPPDAADPSGLDSGFKSKATRDRLHALMVQYHVRAVFCGHAHRYWHSVKDGVDYFITGGAGAPLDASPDEGGFLHYIQVTVEGDKITTQILQPWHLEVDYPEGDNKGAITEKAWVANTNNFPVAAGNIVFHVAPPAPGTSYTAAGTITYKGKTKPQAVTVVSSRANGTSWEVVVKVTLAPHRTTEIVVSPHA